MSFEGYYQCFCKKGHYFVADVYDAPFEGTAKCSFCGEEAVVENLVDTTNEKAVGYIGSGDIEKFLISPEVTNTCDYCLHVHQVSPAIYRIPSKDELQSLRQFCD